DHTGSYSGRRDASTACSRVAGICAARRWPAGHREARGVPGGALPGAPGNVHSRAQLPLPGRRDRPSGRRRWHRGVRGGADAPLGLVWHARRVDHVAQEPRDDRLCPGVPGGTGRRTPPLAHRSRRYPARGQPRAAARPLPPCPRVL
ncbi:MAG: hypothetical protein AVDCRST_MAG77-3317, partial [uncultured Chloroflexi bacterium]